MQQNKKKQAKQRMEKGALKRGQANLDGSGTSKCKPQDEKILNYWMKPTTIELFALNAEATVADRCPSDQYACKGTS